MKRIFKISFLAFATIFALNSCGGKTEKTEETTTTEEVYEVEDATTSNDITIESNDAMQYSTGELRAKAGEITLTLKHTGKMEKAVMGHNLVILKPGTDVNAFGAKAAEAKDQDYIPASESGSVVAHTKLIGGGESDTITFTISEPGTYDYICSFPGHLALMKGKLIVE
ncbi:azurin [Flavobacterium antarcticum]|uniref:azurin n=1 Tax=Flavobacterium antarcticum TaxID=271155 RepID=UPI0003B4CD97|nr:azurin [Flavobacterium antarcticum]